MKRRLIVKSIAVSLVLGSGGVMRAGTPPAGNVPQSLLAQGDEVIE
jgi:hypothetical protein